MTQQQIDLTLDQGAPAGRSASRTLHRQHAGGQGETQARQLIQAGGEIGEIARLDEVDRRGVGLGLGGEIGLGDRLEPPALAHFPLPLRGDAREGHRAEVDDIAAVEPQAQFAQQRGIGAQDVPMGQSPFPDRLRLARQLALPS